MRPGNVGTVLANPAIGLEYLSWRLHRLVGREVTFPLRNGARIGNFANFSEYHSMIGCVAPREQDFFLAETPDNASPILDIGANIGVVSVLLGRAFPGRTIHAFEPGPTTFAALQGNVGLNGLTNIRCHQLALADKPGTIAFDADPGRRATARIATEGSAFRQIVSTTTLDSFVAEQDIASIGLLKIDVEGFETLVLRGAETLLRERMAEMIYMEICPALTESAGFDAAGPVRTVEAAGYRWFRLDDAGAMSPVTAADTKGVVLQNWVARPA